MTALGRLVLTSVEPLGNRTTFSNHTRKISVAADAETFISIPIIEPHPIAPIVEPDVNPGGLQTHENPFWRNEANTLDTAVSQTSSGETESYSTLLQSRNVTTDRNFQSGYSHVSPSVKRNIIKPRAAIKNGVTLRIMVLGASIASGEGSIDLNGFRYGLRNALVAGGNPVNVSLILILTLTLHSHTFLMSRELVSHLKYHTITECVIKFETIGSILQRLLRWFPASF